MDTTLSPATPGRDGDGALGRSRSSPPFTPHTAPEQLEGSPLQLRPKAWSSLSLKLVDTDDEDGESEQPFAAKKKSGSDPTVPESVPPVPRLRSSSLPERDNTTTGSPVGSPVVVPLLSDAAAYADLHAAAAAAADAQVRLALVQVLAANVPQAGNSTASLEAVVDRIIQTDPSQAPPGESHAAAETFLSRTLQEAVAAQKSLESAGVDLFAELGVQAAVEDADAMAQTAVVDADAMARAARNAGLAVTAAVQEHENDEPGPLSPGRGSACLNALSTTAEMLSRYQRSAYFLAIVAVARVHLNAGMICAVLLWCFFEMNGRRENAWLWSVCEAAVFIWQFLFTSKQHYFRGLAKKRIGLWGSPDDQRSFELFWERDQAVVRERTRSALQLFFGMFIVQVSAYLVVQTTAQVDTVDVLSLLSEPVSYISAELNKGVVRAVSYFAFGIIFSNAKDFWWFISTDTKDDHGDVFQKRVNISLNVVTGDENSRPTFHLRTINELPLQEFLPLSNPAVIERAMNHAVDEQRKGREASTAGAAAATSASEQGRFLQVERSVAKQINDQIINQLSSLFGGTFLQWDIAGASAIQQKEYVYAVTYEDDTDTNKKFRLLLIRKDTFARMTTRVDSQAPTRESLRDLKWEFCQFGDDTCRCCMQGRCQCYGSSRIKDLMTLRCMLEEQKMWRNEQTKQTVDKFNATTWSRRGVHHGGPPVGTFRICPGDVVREPDGTVCEVTSVSLNTTGDQVNGFPTADPQQLRRPLKLPLDFERSVPADRLPDGPKGKDLLRKWRHGPVLIAGTIKVAVPEATNQQELTHAVSRSVVQRIDGGFETDSVSGGSAAQSPR
jgi:hypothetical protein